MSMSKKDFIALADAIKEAKGTPYALSEGALDTIATFCQHLNVNFKRGRWMDYIEGKCGPNGGTIKVKKQ